MLSPERVLEAALALAADEGLDRVGVRSVSARLKVTPMALYRHIGDAEALRDATLTAIVELLPRTDDSVGWIQSYRDWATGARSVLSRYPQSARYLLTRWFQLAPMLAQVEALLRTALRGGKRGFEAVAAANAVLMYVLMRVEAENAVRKAGVVERALHGVRRGRSFPLLRRHVAHYEMARFEQHFAYGLEALLAGIEETHHVDPRRSRRRPSRNRPDRERAVVHDHDRVDRAAAHARRSKALARATSREG